MDVGFVFFLKVMVSEGWCIYLLLVRALIFTCYQSSDCLVNLFVTTFVFYTFFVILFVCFVYFFV